MMVSPALLCALRNRGMKTPRNIRMMSGSLSALVAALCFIPVLPLDAADIPPGKFAGLLNNSPFGEARATVAPDNAARQPLEFRGVVVEDSSSFFSIYDPTVRRSAWVEMNESMNGFSVKGYDAAYDSVTVAYQGKLLTLSLKRALVVAQATPPASAGNASQSNPSGQPTAAPGSPQRSQQVQEEIRRRRALRQQTVSATPPSVSLPDNLDSLVPQPAEPDSPQPVPAEP